MASFGAKPDTWNLMEPPFFTLDGVADPLLLPEVSQLEAGGGGGEPVVTQNWMLASLPLALPCSSMVHLPAPQVEGVV